MPIFKYLKLNKYSKETIHNFKEDFFTHSNYPSLYSIVESLELNKIDSIAANIPKEEIDNLPDNFIAVIESDSLEEIVLAQKTPNGYTIEFQNKSSKKVSLERFLQLWNGTILAVDSNELAKRTLYNSNISLATIVTLSILFIIGLSTIYQSFIIERFVIQLILVAGLFISVFIIQEDIGKPSPVVSKLCNSRENNVSCSSVINSKIKSFPLGISFSDLPIVFFSSSFLLVSFKYKFYTSIGFLSTLSIPILIYSIYLQKYIIRKWCMLCLITAALTLALSFIYLFDLFHTKQFTWNFFNLIIFSLNSLLLFLFWLKLKEILKKNIQIFNQHYELNRFKKTFEFFNGLYSKNSTLPIEELDGIFIGNKEAPVQVELFLNPSCNHCYEAYEHCYKLIKIFPDKVKLKVHFNLINMEEDNNPDLIASEIMLHNYFKHNCIKALDDWFSRKYTEDVWFKKWNKTTVNKEVIHPIIKKHLIFCSLYELSFAPIIFIDGKILPEQYKANEVKYFINELINLKEKENPKIL